MDPAGLVASMRHNGLTDRGNRILGFASQAALVIENLISQHASIADRNTHADSGRPFTPEFKQSCQQYYARP
jgi:hypothetical protein